jgi:large subunit ribosomal protein L25
VTPTITDRDFTIVTLQGSRAVIDDAAETDEAEGAAAEAAEGDAED